MNRQDLINRIEAGYKELIQVTVRYRKSAMEYAKMEHDISISRSRLINSGAITGKNADMREAEIWTAMPSEHEALFALGVDRDRLQVDKEISDMSVTALRTILRVYELSDEVFGDEK